MSGTQAPGFFGKIPARGDFLSRRIPSAMAAAWESWLQGLTLAAKQGAPDGWPDVWLTAPLWHFVLGSELAPPHGAAGVMVASADRVGRLFPFTVVGAATPDQPVRLRDWAKSVEALVFTALDDTADPAALDRALTALGPPPSPYGPHRPGGLWRLELQGDWPADGDPFSDEAHDMPGPGQSVWWCRGSDRVDPVRLRCDGLPGPRTAAAMILGGEDVTAEW